MARLILKSPFLKGGKNAGGHVRYIATRERVELVPDGRPATQKQTQLIDSLTKDFPDAKKLPEYSNYRDSPTKVNASAFITRTLEDNWPDVQQRDIYAEYIATRPQVERVGSHGLFGDEDYVDLKKVTAELQACEKNVWAHIISLKREDAARLGYDNARTWRNLLLTHRNDIATAMNIPPNDFRWYAAFHDEGDHPHVHMMAWSSGDAPGYLSPVGIEKIKSMLTNDIFRQEMLHVYEQKRQSWDELVAEARRSMLEVADEMKRGICEHLEAEQMLLSLSRELKNAKGKKQYRYLSKSVKKQVDEIVDQMARYDEPDDILQGSEICGRIWSVVCDDSLPLDLRDEGVERLHTQAEDGEPYAQLLLGKLYRDGPLVTPDWVEARYWFEQAAQSLPNAQYALGKLLLTDDVEIHDREQGIRWLTRAAEQGHAYAQILLARQDSPSLPSAILAVNSLLHSIGRIFQDNARTMDSTQGQHTDHKLRRRILEKKIAMGHKPDDHEEQGWGGMAMR